MSKRCSLQRWENVIANDVGVNVAKTIQHGVRLNDLCFGEDSVRHALRSWSTIASIEFDSEIFIGTSWVVTRRKNESTKAVALSIVGVELPNESGNGGSREEAVLANVHLSDTVGGRDLDDLLDCHIVVVATITRDDHGLANILNLRILLVECIENRLYKVLEVMLLREHLHFLSETAGARLLILIRLLDLDSLNGDLTGPDGGHRPF